mmetsp:Transcript_34011/g.108141  ORF Transcript_34011/g.108141 Transcript_34011/m.108141 type:complete len:486 (-) Transcript_34011:163-1620(-)
MTEVSGLLPTNGEATCNGDQEDAAAKRKDFRVKLPGLPETAYPRQITELAREFAEADMDVPLRATAGAAIPLAAIALMVKWGFSPSFVLLVWHSSECEGGYAAYPWWVWAALLPVELAIRGLEYRCHRLICVPKYQVLKRFKLYGFSLPYWLWFITANIISAGNSVDVASDGAFLGTFLKGENCTAGKDEAKTWEHVMEESMFSLVGEFTPSLKLLVILSWAVGYLQLIYTLLETVPLTCRECRLWRPWTYPHVDYEVARKNSDGTEYRTEYPTALDPYLMSNHGHAMAALAEACCMRMVTADDVAFADAKAEAEFKTRNTANEITYIHYLHALVRRGVFRQFLMGALTNGWQLNLQVTIFMIRRRIENKTEMDVGDWQAVLSMASSAFAIIHRIYDGVKRVRLVLRWKSKLETAIEELENPGYKEKANRALSSLYRYTAALVLGSLISLALSAYALAKLFFSSHFCKHALWNVTGCVSYEHTEN